MESETNDVVLSIAANGTITGLPSNEGVRKSSKEDDRQSKIPNEPLRARKTVSKPLLLKSRSRIVEPFYPIGEAFRERSFKNVDNRSPNRNSPKITPKLSEELEDELEDKDTYNAIILQANYKSLPKLKVLASVEWMMFIILIGLVAASLTLRPLEDISVWSLRLWRWCFLVLVVISGRLVTKWFMNILVYLVERNYLLRKKVLYFLYGLRKSIQTFLWWLLILVAWILLFDRSRGTNRSEKSNEVLQQMTMAIAGCVVGASIWMLKTLLIKAVALCFHVKRFFDRIQESIFYQYVLRTLSGPPMMEMEDETLTKPRNELRFESMTKGKGEKEEVINVEKVHKISPEQVSAWTMRGLVNVIRRTKLSTISSNIVDSGKDYEAGEHNREIASEWEARTAADKVFMNVARPDHKYIDEEDLSRFMKLDEVHEVFHSFEGAVETGKISKTAFRTWVMTVEEMNILTTVFLRYDNEKVLYPNSVLLAKPISNLYRSPDMSEAVEFSVDFSTTVEIIAALKARIKGYIESKPQHWRSSHSVHVKDFLEMNTMTMSLHVNHTINFQNNEERKSRRSDLVLELKKIFEDLGMRYHLLPQEVLVSFAGSNAPASAP